MVKRGMRSVISILLFVLLAACAGDPPAMTQGVRLGIGDIERGAGQSRLQIIITYKGAESTHAALRLEHAGRGTLFWDPGGGYGLATAEDRNGWEELPMPAANRKNDLFLADAPSLRSYWRFSRLTDDTAMEVFEWVLTAERADALHKILLSGARDGGRADGFATKSAPLFCAVSISEFLRKYGRGLATTDENHFWPSDLAARIRAQTPHRTLVFSLDDPKTIFVSGPGHIPDRARVKPRTQNRTQNRNKPDYHLTGP